MMNENIQGTNALGADNAAHALLAATFSNGHTQCDTPTRSSVNSVGHDTLNILARCIN
jgi:hypothetical protein